MGLDTAQKLSLGSLLCFLLGTICLIIFLILKDSGVRSRTLNMIAAEN